MSKNIVTLKSGSEVTQSLIAALIIIIIDAQRVFPHAATQEF